MPFKRSTQATCGYCNTPFRVNAVGRIAQFCRPACRVMAFDKKHGRPKVPMEDRIAGRIWEAMQAANLVPADRPLPPRREDAP